MPCNIHFYCTCDFFACHLGFRRITTKDKINNTIKTMPDSFTIDELIDQLIFVQKVEFGLQQSEDGKVISNEEVKLVISFIRRKEDLLLCGMHSCAVSIPHFNPG